MIEINDRHFCCVMREPKLQGSSALNSNEAQPRLSVDPRHLRSATIGLVFWLLFSVVVGWCQPKPQADTAPIAADARPDEPNTTHVIVATNDVGGQLEIVVDGGSREGIRKDWTPTIVDANGKPMTVIVVVVKVDDHRTVVRASVTRDQLRDKRVRLSAPSR